MVGTVYLERGRPVEVLVRWGTGVPDTAALTPWTRRIPRNVLVLRSDGTRVVRPFRGLRRPPA